MLFQFLLLHPQVVLWLFGKWQLGPPLILRWLTLVEYEYYCYELNFKSHAGLSIQTLSFLSYNMMTLSICNFREHALFLAVDGLDHMARFIVGIRQAGL